MEGFGIIFKGAEIFRRKHWRIVGVGVLTKWNRRTETVFGIIEWHVSWRSSNQKFSCRLFRVWWIQIDGASFSRLVPRPRRGSATFRCRVVRRRSGRSIFRRRYEWFIFGRWLKTRIPILKLKQFVITVISLIWSFLTSLKFADEIFLSTTAGDAVATLIVLSKIFKPSCVSCKITSNDSATRDTSISFAEMESDAMELSEGIAITFSSLDILKIKQKKKKVNACVCLFLNLKQLPAWCDWSSSVFKKNSFNVN